MTNNDKNIKGFKEPLSRFKLNLLSFVIAINSSAITTMAIAEDELVLEEIIITVSRRQQNLQDFAGTAQVFSSEDLLKSGVGSDINNLQVVIPGLQISDNEGFKEIYIRGIGTQSNGATDDSATAVHLNGVYLPRSRGIGPVMYDLERVEVNKGPQGTLRGRNATAGSVNFITRRPDFDSISGYATAGAGNFNSNEFEGALNIPVSDTLAVRGALYHREHDNTYSNNIQSFTAQNVDGVGAENEDAVRLSVLWEPTDKFSALFVYDTADQKGTGLPGNYFGQAFSSGETVDSLDDPYNQHFLTKGNVTNDIEGVNFVFTYDFGNMILEYNGGYREHEAFNQNARRPFQFGLANDEILSVNDVLSADFDNFGTNFVIDNSEAVIQELRLYSPDDARLRWTTGIFSLQEEQNEMRFDISDKSITQSSLGGESHFNTDIEAFSVFADATYDVTDSIRVSAGVRRTKDKKSSDGWEAQYAFDFGPNVTADDIRFGSPGYKPTLPGERKLFNPLDPNVSAAQFFLDGVQSFGQTDTLGQLIALNPDGVSLTTTNPDGLHTREFEETYTDWRLATEWDFSDELMLYAKVTTGSRSGGINNEILLSQGPNLPPLREKSNFNREQLTSWELGSKWSFDWNEMPVRFNANLFLYQYEDQVLQVAGVAAGGGFTPGSSNVNANLVTRNVNIGESEILGLELDGGILLPFSLDLGWNIAILDSEYTDAIVVDGRQNANTNVDISGNQMLNVSKYNAVIHIGQTQDWNWGYSDWRLTASYRSSFHATQYEGKGYDANGNEIPLSQMQTCCFDNVNNGSFFNDKVDGFIIYNVNAGVNFGGNNQYRVEAYVNNITEEAYTQKQIINYFVNIGFLNVPRTAGIRFNMEF